MSLPPSTEDATSTGKRKRSPISLADASLSSSFGNSQSVGAPWPPIPKSFEEHPLPKKPRLPPRPPTPASENRASIKNLSPSVLQHIFSFVDPLSLGNLLRVNQRFCSLLDTRYVPLPLKEDYDAYPTRSQDSIWSSSRRRYVPTMPKPIDGLSEHAQLALTFGKGCQFCNQKSVVSTSNPWQAGPGLNGVRIIWPFKIRSCNDCLAPRLRKETEVLLSDASPLRPGLPFALFTHSMHFVPLSLVRDSSIPLGVELQKYYYVNDLDLLQEKANEARSFGPAAAEEWFKGLPGQAQQMQNDKARFEQWELGGGLDHSRLALFTMKSSDKVTAIHPVVVHTLPDRPSMSIATLQHDGASLPLSTPLPPMPSYGLAPGLEHPYRAADVQSDSFSMGSQRSTGTQKASKSSRERAKIRAYKKAEIIERSSKLSPPISRDMLERLDAFDATLQVSIPLNENSWETLKKRLLLQRHKMVLEDEARNAVRIAPIPGQFRPPSRSDEYVLAHTDTPRKEKLCQIAEEYIKQKWGHGAWVTYPKAPQFAAEVLLHTKQTYLDDEARAVSLQAQNGFVRLSTPQEESLKLEDMKWIFEQTVKPRTEQIRKDLFLCPICPATNTVKYFAFESIIQHYASKHTTAFSNGPQKVTWKAEWPETPPFNAHPERVHTPTPSITHTPTLSHQHLSAISPGSIMTSGIPSAGWHTPDTMSLVSSTTRTYSISGHSTRPPDVASSAPGYGMYEMQREELARGLSQGWNTFPNTLQVPDSLRIYAAVSFALTYFTSKYSNEPTLDLFRDCIDTKQDLKDLRDAENLRCAECLVNGSPNPHTTWSLPDLIIHFRKAHIDSNHSASRPDWRNDMIALPEPLVVKSIQIDPVLPDVLRAVVEQAVSTSQILHCTAPTLRLGTNDYSLHPDKANEALTNISTHHVSYNEIIPPTQESRIFNNGERSRIVSSVAATYGDKNTSQDLWSTDSRTVSERAPSGSLFYGRPDTHTLEQIRHSPGASTLPNKQTRLREHLRSRNNSDINGSHGEAMSRSNTVRSYHSKAEPRQSTAADDFLSTIESNLDVEMADAGLLHARSGHPSRPSSRSNSAVGASSRASQQGSASRNSQQIVSTTRELYDNDHSSREIDRWGESKRDYDQRSLTMQGDSIEREPSVVVEFDQHGTPIPRTGRVYHENSSTQRGIARQYVDIHGLPISSTSQIYPREAPPGYRESNERRRYVEGPPHPNHPYESIEYVPTPPFRPDRIYDQATGQYYIAERPAPRQYVEIEDRYPRQQALYDQHVRPVHYREVDLANYRSEDVPENHSPEYYDRRFSGR